MRSRLTNVLQVIVLITGIVYITTGAVFAVSPQFFGTIFGVQVTPDCYESIKFDTFIAPLYHFARTFAIMVGVMGLAMILPLFDPLRYRGLVYYTGVIFPLLAAIILLLNGFKFQHTVLIAMGIVFSVIFLLTSCATMVTRNKAKKGEE